MVPKPVTESTPAVPPSDHTQEHSGARRGPVRVSVDPRDGDPLWGCGELADTLVEFGVGGVHVVVLDYDVKVV